MARQQLSDDPYADVLYDPYLSSQIYDLGVLEPGQTVRIRFHFETLDALQNAFQGWAIDDVGVTTTPPDVSTDPHEPNNSVQEATAIQAGDTINGIIQPKGDFDYFQFSANAGDRIVADIDAESLGSSLDPYLFLLDSDGVSVLASNDDEVYSENRDSFITFYAPHAGTYYLKLRAWNNPRSGGSQYFYMLHLFIDNLDPVMAFANPANPAGYLNSLVNTLTATVIDTPSGIAQVDFYFHDNNWTDHNWELLGSDTDGSNGWSAPFYQIDQSDVGLYVKATDFSRNITGHGYWNLAVDRTPPESALLPLDSNQTSTAFLLEWTGSDNLSGIDHYGMKWSIDGGTWQTYTYTFTGYTQSAWVVGAPGHNYAFRMNSIDRAGNEEPFTQMAETSTYIPLEICTAPDTWEIDNSAITASKAYLGQAQLHNFCNPETDDGLHDTDWITFTVQAGQRYLIQAYPTATNAAAALRIYTGNGITLTLRAEITPTNWGQPTFIDWIASEDEVLYIRVQHADERVAGNTVTYQVYVTKNYPVFMPVISRRP
jgi:Bacterial pre-peptidase C-terminal domain